MTALYVPSQSEILEVAQGRGALSDAPHLWRGLVGAWPLQEGGGNKAWDVSGYRNHGTLTNMDPATDWVVTEKGRALDFDGSNDHILCAAPINPVNDHISIVAWILVNNLTSAMTIAGQAGAGTTSGCSLSFRGDATGDPLRFTIYGDSDNNSSATGVLAGVWNHVGVAYDKISIRFYVNGNLLNTTAKTSSITLATYQASISALNYNGSIVNNLAGKITGCHAFGRALTPSEIQQLYSDPWAMYRMRRRVFKAAAVAPSGVKWWTLRQRSRLIGAGGVA